MAVLVGSTNLRLVPFWGARKWGRGTISLSRNSHHQVGRSIPVVPPASSVEKAKEAVPLSASLVGALGYWGVVATGKDYGAHGAQHGRVSAGKAKLGRTERASRLRPKSIIHLSHCPLNSLGTWNLDPNPGLL